MRLGWYSYCCTTCALARDGVPAKAAHVATAKPSRLDRFMDGLLPWRHSRRPAHAAWAGWCRVVGYSWLGTALRSLLEARPLPWMDRARLPSWERLPGRAPRRYPSADFRQEGSMSNRRPRGSP